MIPWYIFIASAAAPLSANPETPHINNQYGWISFAAAIVVSLISGFFGWWKSKPKEKNDQFVAFMNESAEFRDEVRNEREKMRDELYQVKNEKSEFERKMTKYQKESQEYMGLIKRQETEIAAIRSQLAILQENRMYKAIIDHLPHIVWTSDSKGNVNYYNARAYQYANLPYVAGRDIGYLKQFHPDDLEDFMKVWAECIETGKPYFYEYRLRRGYDGMYRWHIGAAIPRIDDTGNIVEWIGSVTDIHDYKLGLIPHRGLFDEPSPCKAEAAEALEQRKIQKAIPLKAVPIGTSHPNMDDVMIKSKTQPITLPAEISIHEK